MAAWVAPMRGEGRMSEMRVDQLADELVDSLSDGELELVVGGSRGPFETLVDFVMHEAR